MMDGCGGDSGGGHGGDCGPGGHGHSDSSTGDTSWLSAAMVDGGQRTRTGPHWRKEKARLINAFLWFMGLICVALFLILLVSDP